MESWEPDTIVCHAESLAMLAGSVLDGQQILIDNSYPPQMVTNVNRAEYERTKQMPAPLDVHRPGSGFLSHHPEHDEALQEIVAWAELITSALAGVAGLSVTDARQAVAHLVKARTLLGRTSSEAPDDRPSKWPEGEGS